MDRSMSRRPGVGWANRTTSTIGDLYHRPVQQASPIHASPIRRARGGVGDDDIVTLESTRRHRRDSPLGAPLFPSTGVVTRRNLARQGSAGEVCGFEAMWNGITASRSPAAPIQGRRTADDLGRDGLWRQGPGNATSGSLMQHRVPGSLLERNVLPGRATCSATFGSGFAFAEREGAQVPTTASRAEQAYVGGTRRVTRHFSYGDEEGMSRHTSARTLPTTFLGSDTQGLFSVPTRSYHIPKTKRAASLAAPRREVRAGEALHDRSDRSGSHNASLTRQESGYLGRVIGSEEEVEYEPSSLNGRRTGSSIPDNTTDAQWCAVSRSLLEEQGGVSHSRTASGRGGAIDLFAAERFTSDMHRSLASSVIRSVFSAVASPLSASLATTWEEQEASLFPRITALERTLESRLVLGGSGTSILIFTASSLGGRPPATPEEEISRFLEELGCMFYLDGHGEGECPILHLAGGSGFAEAGEALGQWLADIGESRVPPQQVHEARNLLSSLDQHTVTWKFEEKTPNKTVEGERCRDARSGVVGATSRKVGSWERGPLGVGTNGNDAVTPRCERERGLSSDTQNGKVCCICLSPFEGGDILLTLRCLHIFHASCLNKWIKTSHSVKCPLCLTAIAEQTVSA